MNPKAKDIPCEVKKTLSSFYRIFAAFPFIAVNTLVASYACIAARAMGKKDVANLVPVIWARLCCAVIPMQVRVHGRENYHTDQNYVVVANHQSLADIPVIQGYLGLNLKWVMKKELEKIPIFGTACKKLGYISVDRNNTAAAVQALHAGKNRLQPSDSMVFFPEGTRSEDGLVLPFKKGAFFFAAESNLPILPVTIVNTSRIIAKGSLRLHSGTVDIIVHPPVFICHDDKHPMEEIVKNVRNTIIGDVHGRKI